MVLKEYLLFKEEVGGKKKKSDRIWDPRCLFAILVPGGGGQRRARSLRSCSMLSPYGHCRSNQGVYPLLQRERDGYKT